MISLSSFRSRPRRGAAWFLFARPSLVVLAFAAVLAGCGDGADYRRYSGSTMGTYYEVTARCPLDVSADIEEELLQVNAEMSTYLPDSALSRFNRAPIGEWFAVPETLVEVVAAAETLSRESAGAFDVTVGPLVNLWGFGPPKVDRPPTAAEVEDALARVGYTHLEVRWQPPALRKQADLYVDLSGIAKGHGVDRVVSRLRQQGCESMLVDIGGD
ncbi:MAG: FAD:protein FMN transferase, partial [Pseudomonadales bacterium]